MENKSNNKIKYFLIILVCVFALTVYLIFGLFMVPMRIDGTSMYPTLENEQMVYVQKPFVKYEYGMIVVFERPNENYMCIKRIMGMPNDKIRITDGKLYRNGELAEDYYNRSNQYMETLSSNQDMVVVDGELTLGEDEYFMMGDNRGNSFDSRSYGAVKKDRIVGKALFIKD